MSANPFELGEIVDSEFTVEKITTEIVYLDYKTNESVIYDKENLIWNVYDTEEYLTLDEILKQIIEKENINDEIPLIQVIHETGLWGVIFEVGNYKEAGKQWLVHGITRGYA